jgi:hypothetical protein
VVGARDDDERRRREREHEKRGRFGHGLIVGDALTGSDGFAQSYVMPGAAGDAQVRKIGSGCTASG